MQSKMLISMSCKWITGFSHALPAQHPSNHWESGFIDGKYAQKYTDSQQKPAAAITEMQNCLDRAFTPAGTLSS